MNVDSRGWPASNPFIERVARSSRIELAAAARAAGVALLVVACGQATASAGAAAPAAPSLAEPDPAVDTPVLPPGIEEALSTPTRWDVRPQDITLARTLERWAAQAGYHVKWDAQRNFLIGASDTYEGSFEWALQTLLGSAGIRASDYPLEACIYANTPPLVRITRLGEQARECGAP